MKKVYLNTLTPEEVIKRLGNGEVIKKVGDNSTISLINGILVRKSGLYAWINDNLCISDNESLYYFEEEESIEITETGVYKTRDGRKAYIFRIDKDEDDAYPVVYVVENEAYTLSATKQGKNVIDHETSLDIVAKWEE